MHEVRYDVDIEPYLEALLGDSFNHQTRTTEDEAGLDIIANALCETRFSKTFLDVKIFNPFAKSCSKCIPEAYSHF